MKNWYLLQTKVHQERKAKLNLERQDYQIYQPQILVRKLTKNRWHSTLEPLFPRYLFVLLDEGDNWSKINSTLGVSHFIRFGKNTLPTAVSTEVINNLQIKEKALTREISPGMQFKKGDKVLLSNEMFTEVSAIFETTSKDERIYILLNLLGKEHRISVTEADIKPLK